MYTINQARSIAINSVQDYETILKNKQFIVIYRDAVLKDTKYIEIVFLSRNYQHLTGLVFLDDKGMEVHGKADYFYKKCFEKKLANKDIAFKKDGTTQLKLEALPAVVRFTSISKITGDSNGNQPFLYDDKLVGGVNFCIGLRIDDKIGQYVPVSALQRNIKELTDKPSQVLAIFERNYGDTSVYKKIRHVAKDCDLYEADLSQEILKKISLQNYKKK